MKSNLLEHKQKRDLIDSKEFIKGSQKKISMIGEVKSWTTSFEMRYSKMSDSDFRNWLNK